MPLYYPFYLIFIEYYFINKLTQIFSAVFIENLEKNKFCITP